MNKAIITPRTLKNTETGIDITVPEFRTIAKLLSTQEEFHVIIISSLPYFKSPDHKPEDVVQFMVPKKESDFESLHKAMSDRYPATIFPDLPKKVLMLRDSTPQGRRVAFEKLMQFIASNPKVCCSQILLEFLGVPLSKINAVEGKDKASEGGDDAQKESVANTTSPTKSVKSQSSSLFGEDDSDDELFKTADKVDEDETDSYLFSPSPHHAPLSTKDNTDVLIVGADDRSAPSFLPLGTSTDVTSPEILRLANEDNSDILNVEDDLGKLLSISDKPKPSVLPKSSQSASKPAIKPRPGKKPSAALPKDSSLGVLDQSEQMAEDDILKYIRENCDDGEAKLDLF